MLGDDLALNAEQVSGVRVDRELPVVGGRERLSFEQAYFSALCRADKCFRSMVNCRVAGDRRFVFML